MSDRASATGAEAMDFERVKEACLRAAGEHKELTCHEARHLGEELGVEYSVVGRACNKVGVGLRRCQWAPFCICDNSLNRKGSQRSSQADKPEGDL
jgi:hypothetical protein